MIRKPPLPNQPKPRPEIFLCFLEKMLIQPTCAMNLYFAHVKRRIWRLLKMRARNNIRRIWRFFAASAHLKTYLGPTHINIIGGSRRLIRPLYTYVSRVRRSLLVLLGGIMSPLGQLIAPPCNGGGHNKRASQHCAPRPLMLGHR